MEIHFIHQSDDNNLAVLGVLVKEGKHNKNFDQFIEYLPNETDEKITDPGNNSTTESLQLMIYQPNKLTLKYG